MLAYMLQEHVIAAAVYICTTVFLTLRGPRIDVTGNSAVVARYIARVVMGICLCFQALISGNGSTELVARSMLSSLPGFTAYKLETESEFRSKGLLWATLDKFLPEVKDSVKGTPCPLQHVLHTLEQTGHRNLGATESR